MKLMEVGCRLHGLRLDYRLYKLGVISQERLKIEVKLLLSANRKSYAASIRCALSIHAIGEG